MQESNRSTILWHHLSLNSMKAHALETKLDHGPRCLGHHPLTPIAPGKIIAEFSIAPQAVPGNIPTCTNDGITLLECYTPTKAFFLFKALSLPLNKCLSLLNSGKHIHIIVLHHFWIREDTKDRFCILSL